MFMYIYIDVHVCIYIYHTTHTHCILGRPKYNATRQDATQSKKQDSQVTPRANPNLFRE